MLTRTAVFGIAFLHLVFLGIFHEPGYNSPDAHGYFLQGKLLAETGHCQLEDESPVQFVGVHWLETACGELYSRYPAGLPILISIVYKFAGAEATTWINLVLCSLSLPFVFFTTRHLTSPAMGIMAMLFLAINPVFNQYALNADSHISTLFFLVAGLAALANWDKTGNFLWALAAGFLLGYIPAIRYPEVLFGIGIAAFLCTTVIQDHSRLKGAMFAFLGALIPVLCLLLKNTLAFDAPFRTAYSLTNEQSGFSLEYFLGSYRGYLEGLMASGLGPAFVVGILGIVGMLLKREMRKWGILILFTAMPITLLYMAYYFGNGSEITMRFVLPTFPLYIMAACFLIQELASHWKLNPVWIGLVLILLTSLTAIPESISKLAGQSLGIRANVLMVRALQSHVPERNVLFMGQQLAQLADFLGDWKIADDQLLATRQRPLEMRGPFGAGQDKGRPSPRQVDRREETLERYQDLSPEDKMDLVLADAKTWAGSNSSVYIVTHPVAITGLQNSLHPDYKWVFVADITLDDTIQHDWRNTVLKSFANDPRRTGPGAFRRGVFSDKGTLSVYKLALR